MAYRFVLPDLGEGVTEGEITAWLVAAGQEVREDEPMVEVETDKATVEIASPVDGTVLELHATPGERVAVGAPLVTFDEHGDDGATEAPIAASAGPVAASAGPLATSAGPLATSAALVAAAESRATPVARRVAKELGVELSAVAGTGPDGAITERDVRAATATPRSTERREQLRGVRRRIAERLTRSQQQIPQVTVVEECDFTDLSRKRRELSYTAFAVRATISGLREFDELNASLDGDEIVYHDRYDIGIATQGPKGLVVPVLRSADAMSLNEIDAEVARLTGAVRDDTIAPEELRGGTFTLTLAGKLGGLFATPLVNPGEAAILGVHRIGPRPVVRDGEIVVAQIGLVSCSFDHRITDGTRASMFLLHVIDQLQSP